MFYVSYFGEHIGRHVCVMIVVERYGTSSIDVRDVYS